MGLDAGHDAGDTDRAFLAGTSVFPTPEINASLTASRRLNSHVASWKRFHVNSNWTCLLLNMTSEMPQMECELTGNFLLTWLRSIVFGGRARALKFL